MKTILVVGASRGIGLVIAQHLVASGFRVIGTVRSESAGASLEAVGITPLVLDVTDRAAVAALPEHLDHLDGLVYNAGLSVAGPVELLDIDLAQAEVNVNYVGAAAVTKALLPLLRSRRGHIVYVTSVNGTAPVGLYASYSASKFGLRSFADTLRAEERGRIKVTSIHPGRIDTDMQRAAYAAMGLPYDPAEHLAPATVARAVKYVLEAGDGAVVEMLQIRPEAVGHQ